MINKVQQRYMSVKCPEWVRVMRQNIIDTRFIFRKWRLMCFKFHFFPPLHSSDVSCKWGKLGSRCFTFARISIITKLRAGSLVHTSTRDVGGRGVFVLGEILCALIILKFFSFLSGPTNTNPASQHQRERIEGLQIRSYCHPLTA